MINLNDIVHLGFSVKGGAGYTGKLIRIEGNTAYVHINTDKFGPRIVKGPIKNIRELWEANDYSYKIREIEARLKE